METRHYWEENGHPAKYENYNSNDGFGRAGAEQLNFAVPSEDEADYPPGAYLKKGKVSRQDPMSHRIIEKRRRDRMNNCLADLSRLIPPEYLKKGRGRVEKTEIIEMAIRHLKYLQDCVNAAERQVGDEFRAGFQEAVSEAVRFLVDVQGYGQDGVCSQLAAHLQRHCEIVTKGDIRRDKMQSQPGSSSETGSSSSSSHGYAAKGVIARRLDPPEPYQPQYETKPDINAYPMDCDRVPTHLVPVESEEARHKREPTLRAVRKPEHADDTHSYKFKNSIERRFSMSQDQATDMSVRAHKAGSHKRRRAKPPPPSTSASASTEEAQDTSPQDTSSESPRHQHFDNSPPTQFVPVFALNALGKYYVPLSVEAGCVGRAGWAALDARAAQRAAPLHPVTIHVNFQPCFNYHERRDWAAV